jgi:cytochrome d ubiquinol oxidase subunit I
VVRADQVLGSILMFGLLYSLLFVLWLWVLNHKIQAGPAPSGAEPDETTGRDVLEAAALRAGHEETLTGARGPAPAGNPS